MPVEYSVQDVRVIDSLKCPCETVNFVVEFFISSSRIFRLEVGRRRSYILAHLIQATSDKTFILVADLRSVFKVSSVKRRVTFSVHFVVEYFVSVNLLRIEFVRNLLH